MEHLTLEIFDKTGTGSKFAALPSNTRIHVRRTSQIFGKGNVWTHEFSINIPANAHIFGTAGELHGARLHEQIDKRRARLWVEGLPLYYGYLRLGSEADVDEDGNVDVSFESGHKTFEDMIEGGKANQVPMMGDVQFGVALLRKRKVAYGLALSAYAVFEDDKGTSEASDVKASGETIIGFGSDGEYTPIQQYPRMVFPRGSLIDDSKPGTTETEFNFLNTDTSYDDGHPYCNIALCYQRYGYEKKDANGNTYDDYGSEPEAQRGYEEMPADRVNSAPCFFVLYWLRALMRHLGIHIEENQLMSVEDLRRLFFVNTNCAYEEPQFVRNGTVDAHFGRYQFGSERLVAEQLGQVVPPELLKTEESGFTCTAMQGEPSYDHSLLQPSEVPTIERVVVKISSVDKRDAEDVSKYKKSNNYLFNAFATSDCFPNVEISEVINALENAFGVRFLFDTNYQRVRIILLRNIFENGAVQDLGDDVAAITKLENNIRGFRMTYGAGTEDTHFYYKGFADKLPHQKELWPDTSDEHDYSQWDLNADYASTMQKVAAFDKTCYVTPVNGNAFGVKIDKDARRYDELHQALFEFAGFMDAEDGDCSGDAETIEEISVGFTPAIMNDLNMEEERNEGSSRQRFALFVDEQMRPRRLDYKRDVANNSFNDPDAVYDVDELYKQDKGKADDVVKPGEFAITSDMYAIKEGLTVRLQKTIVKRWAAEFISVPVTWNLTIDIEGHINEGYRIYLQDNYEPNDDGISPIETHDWGLTLGIMRGSGSDARVEYSPDEQDGEDNDTWDIRPGSSTTAHPDTCDSYGNLWDYNGEEIVSVATAAAKLAELFPQSNAAFRTGTNGYINGAGIFYLYDTDGKRHSALLVTSYSTSGATMYPLDYVTYPEYLSSHSVEEMWTLDAAGHGGIRNLLVEIDSSQERCDTMLKLCNWAWGQHRSEHMKLDNGVGSLYGRFSLKLRAEKPNPYFDTTQPESDNNRRYLEITDPNLQGRGLADQFYKEYSYWVRNARIANIEKELGIAQLSTLDDTVRVHVGDVTGFIQGMEFDVDIQTGLGPVTMKVMYI